MCHVIPKRKLGTNPSHSGYKNSLSFALWCVQFLFSCKICKRCLVNSTAQNGMYRHSDEIS